MKKAGFLLDKILGRGGGGEQKIIGYYFYCSFFSLKTSGGGHDVLGKGKSRLEGAPLSPLAESQESGK